MDKKKIKYSWKFKIDLGILNKKQLNRLLESIRKSDLDVIETHVLKIKENMSVVLGFRNEKEKRQFDEQSEELVKDLRRLS